MTDLSEKRALARKIFCPDNGRVKLGLAPMAGVTDLPYRMLCREMGADFAVSEMISAKGFLLNRKPNDNVRALYAVAPCETVGIQLFAANPSSSHRRRRRLKSAAVPSSTSTWAVPCPR